MNKKVLFIRYKKPDKIFEGGEQLTQTHLEALYELFGKENVDVFHVHEHDRKRSIWDIIYGSVLFLFDYHFGLTPNKVQSIVKKLDKYDYLFIGRSIFGIIAKKAKKMGYKGQIISFFHNVEKDYFDAKLPHIPGRGIVLRCVDRNDAMTCRYSDVILALNTRDANLIENRYHRKVDAFLPVMLRDKYKKDSYSTELTQGRPRCLFLGTYFGPNVDGLEWFVDNVFPYVDITLDIVGKGMEKLSGDKYKQPGITVIPNAPSLLPFFEKSDIMVLPIFSGAGMKVKTCESLMFGKNIIGSTEAFEGYEADFDSIGGKCDTAQEFIDAIKGFIKTPRPVFNNYSRSVYLEKYSFKVMFDTLRKIMS